MPQHKKTVLSSEQDLVADGQQTPRATPSSGLDMSGDASPLGSLGSSGSSGSARNHGTGEGYVGFADLPNKIYRNAVKRGFDFTLMVVGEAGLGKSTLVNSMFMTDVYSSEYPGPSHRVKKTVQVETTRVLLREGFVSLRLAIVDTPGFGDAVDNTRCWQPIIDYIHAKYAEYFEAESRVIRTTLPDNMVHCCLYFIAPSGHGLKPLDIEFMKRLHDKVNIVPVIAKADTMTSEECSLFKQTIARELQQNGIRVYEFPDVEDDEMGVEQKEFKRRWPFAVVGSNTVVEVNGRRFRGRKYPWGVVDIENMEHCDFLALRNMIIRSWMQDLKDITTHVHYENYRYRRLAAAFTGTGMPSHSRFNENSREQIEEKKDGGPNIHFMEAGKEEALEMKIRERKLKLADGRANLERWQETMERNLKQQKLELEQKRRAFEREKLSFELAYKH